MENPALFNDIKIEPPEELLASDFNLPQVEPVDLSFHKPKAPLQPASMLQAPIRPPKPPSAAQAIVVSTSSDTGTSATIPTVLTPGSILASSQGTGGQPILHVIHTIPSVGLPNKMGGLKTIPLVVQSLPMVYTSLPADGSPAAITVPLIGGDGKNAGSGECRVYSFLQSFAYRELLFWAILSCLFSPLPILRGTVSKGTCFNYHFLKHGFKIISV